METGHSGSAKQDGALSAPGRAGLAARDAAVALLDAVLSRGQALDSAIADQSRKGAFAPLDSRDRALARAIAATALRRLGQLDALLSGLLERPLPKATGLLKHILRAALGQILFMETPVHAVVDLAVHQAKSSPRTKRFEGLVNAVLRRAAREGEAILARQDATQLNTPPWLWARWSSQYGEATTAAIARAHLSEAALDLSVKADAAGWADRLGGVVLPTGSVRLAHKGRIESLEGYDEGTWWVQDAAAALPASFLGDVANKTIADLCAAPGGKTAQLAAGGGTVTAVDISAPRLTRLAANLSRLGLKAHTIAENAVTWRPDEKFDAVLVDPPCLATGTIRRHPDIPHLKRVSDLKKLVKLQQALLVSAVQLAKPGGTVIYCTCSLEAEECEAQIQRLLDTRTGVRVDPIAPREVAGATDWLTPEGYLRTLPHFLSNLDPGLNGIDGFFAARLQVSKVMNS